ncbi:MAG: glycosyltransferase family 2 protein [Dehalococcoidia bacterium]|nr:glycosyltransferase family 2 protein [Dehalococcoidia bacterium]
MEPKPLVSIITPTYNHEAFIGQCIESVLAQTYGNWEQIIIDDGSTDATGAVVARYHDSRIRYVRQDNVGIWNLSKTYNRALEMARGGLVAILEGDDYWPPDKLEKQVPSLTDPQVALSFGRVLHVSTDGQPLWTGPKDMAWFETATQIQILRRLILANFLSSSTVMCRRSALEAAGGFRQASYTPYVDHPTWLQLSLVGELRPVNAILGCWRFHRHQTSADMVMSMAEGRRYSIEFFRSLPQDVKTRLNLTLEYLQANQRRHMTVAVFHVGRLALLSGQWDEAKTRFRQVWREGSFSWKLRASLGLTCAYCHRDLEWIARLVNRSRYAP